MKDLELREKYTKELAIENYNHTEDIQKINTVHNNNLWKIFEPVLKRIQELTPDHLRGKVDLYFNFEQEEKKSHFNLYTWMKDSVFSTIGMIQIRNHKFSKDDLEEISDAWKDFIVFNTEYHSIHVVPSEFSRKKNKENHEWFMEIIRHVNS